MYRKSNAHRQQALRLDPTVDLDLSTEEVEKDAGAIANKFAAME